MVVPESKAYESEDAFNSAWPLWQDGMQQRRLVAVEVEDKLDSLFESLFQTHSSFQKKAQDARRYTQLEETNWTVNVSDLPAWHNFQWTHGSKELREITPSAGMMRKMLFTCPGNGLHPGAFRTEQVERCIEYTPGKRFVVDICVLSSPMYCDKFRPIVRYTAERLSATEVKLTIDSQIIFIAKVNFFLKAFIENSAKGGMEESYRKWLETLQCHYPDGVFNLLTAPKQRRTPKPKKQKDLKSHRLTDVPLEIVDEEESIKSKPQLSTISILLLTLLLTVLRIIWLLVSIPEQLAAVVVSVSRRVTSCISWSVILQAFVLLFLAILTHYVPQIPLSTLYEAYHSPYGAPACFILSFFAGAYVTHMLR